MKNLIVLILFSLLLQNCVTFDKKLVNPVLVNKTNINDLNGRYEMFSSSDDTIRIKQKLTQSFLNEMQINISKRDTILDSLKNYEFAIEVINNKKIKLSFFEDGNRFKSMFLKGKLKKDGYFHIKNKVKTWGIPYLVGALHINKKRLSVSKKGDLIFDSSHHRSGAFLLFVFLDGNNWRYRNIYRMKE